MSQNEINKMISFRVHTNDEKVYRTDSAKVSEKLI